MSVRRTILENLASQLLTITSANDYSVDIRRVSLIPISLVGIEDYLPAIYIDQISESVQVYDGFANRYLLKLNLQLFVRNTEIGAVALNDFLEDFKTLIYSPINLGANVKKVRLNGMTRDFLDANEGYQIGIYDVDIIYVESTGLVQGSGTPFYGTEGHIITAHSKVIAELEELKTAMATGYYPTFGYVYSRHSVADLSVNSLSVECNAIVDEQSGKEQGTVLYSYLIYISVRAHVDYEGGFADSVNIMRLLNSVENWLLTHIDLGDGYSVDRTEGYRAPESFSASASLGGEINVLIRYIMDYTQA